jgi:hypothetical protein
MRILPRLSADDGIDVDVINPRVGIASESCLGNDKSRDYKKKEGDE